MPYEDKDRIAEFYSKAFGWKMQKLGEEMGNYVTAQTTETDNNNMVKTPGAINGGFFPKKIDWPAQYPSVVIAVDDVQSAMKKLRILEEKCLGNQWKFPASVCMYHLWIRKETVAAYYSQLEACKLVKTMRKVIFAINSIIDGYGDHKAVIDSAI